MTQVQVKSSDIIKLILQFLKENNLVQSFETLQRQSKTTLNTIDTNFFIESIMTDRWDEVLQIVNCLMLNQDHLFNLYQLIADDLIEHDRYQAAQYVIRAFIKNNIKNQTNYKEKILRLQYIIENPHEKAIHKRPVTQHRKKQVIKHCLSEIHRDVEPNRLLKLLTQSIKYQSHEGIIKPNIKLNLFEGKQKIVIQEQQTIIKNIEKVVRYPQDAKINCLALSWGEQLLALGGLDGLIEIYNTIDYTYHTGLKFQAEGTALFHDHPITIMQFNPSDDMLASADSKGLIKLWNLQNGKLLRKIQTDGVGSVCWGLDPSHILAGYQDIQLYGIRSCTVIKEYNLSTNNEFINKILVSENRVYAITNAGLVKVFSYSTHQELISTNLKQHVVSVTPIYQSRGSNNIDRILISTTKKIFQLNRNGQEENRYTIQVGQLILGISVGQYLYEFVKVDDKTVKLNVIDRITSKNVYYCAVEGEVSQACMQRNKNLMICYDDRNILSFWRQVQ